MQSDYDLNQIRSGRDVSKKKLSILRGIASAVQYAKHN